MLKANPKAGKRDTLTQGFEADDPALSHDRTTKQPAVPRRRQNMTDSLNMLVEYGGMEAKAKASRRTTTPTTTCH